MISNIPGLFFLAIYTLDKIKYSRVLNYYGDKKTDSDKKE